ncbi:hypothetical protein C6A37_12720, partial [Desulfobacteraceae bacterium SEEP-SAG9]
TIILSSLEIRNKFLAMESTILLNYPEKNEIISSNSTQLLKTSKFLTQTYQYLAIIVHSHLQLLNSIAYFYDIEFNQDENSCKERVPYTLN